MRSRLSLFVALAALLSGCVTEVHVGVENLTVPSDAGTPELDAHVSEPPADAGACQPSDCTDAPLKACMPLECVRNDEGQCAWQTEDCAPDDAGEPPACTPQDCTIVLLTAEKADSLVCGDGQAPVCQRNDRGLCSLTCAAEFSCGVADGVVCGPDNFCAFALGECSSSGGTSGVCAPRPITCDAKLDPVCGCDGNTHNNACEATAKGVNVAFVGPCTAEPEACETCTGPVPPSPDLCADDANHKVGPACVKGPAGACVWQWLACPTMGACGSLINDVAPGRCRTDSDCMTGETCEGAASCPCESECFSPEFPGYCKKS